MLNQQLQTLPAVGMPALGLFLYADTWQLSNSSRRCESVSLTIREHGQFVSCSFDLLIFTLKIANLNKQHVRVAYMLVFPMQ